MRGIWDAFSHNTFEVWCVLWSAMCAGPSPTLGAPTWKTTMIEKSAMVNSTIAKKIGEKEGEKNKNGNKYIFKAQKILRK